MRRYALFAITIASALVLARTRIVAAEDPNVVPVTKFDGPARGEPTPALRYRLLPTYVELKPGNAAIVYCKIAQPRPGRAEIDRRIADDWRETPVDKLPREKVDSNLRAWSYQLAEADRAARMEICDWQLAIRTEKLWELRLDEAQEMRNVARVVALRARLQIHDRKYDEAIYSLQTGFAMARHVAEGQTIVNALVGAAIAGLMLEEVETMMRAPDAPNLYWALTALPRPLIDMRLALSAEMHFVDYAIPGAHDLRQANYSPDQWRDLVQKMDTILIAVNGGDDSAEAAGLLSTMLAVKSYPIARQALIDGGLTAEAVDKMPVPQVIAIYKIESFNRLRDNMFKWMFVPVWQQQPGLSEADDALSKSHDTLEGYPLTELLPAIRASTVATVRLERRIISLAAVEALRMHAAAHGGKLPTTLAEIRLAPVLADPTTGHPFGYSVRGAKATLTSPPLPNLPAAYAGLHYEITITP